MLGVMRRVLGLVCRFIPHSSRMHPPSGISTGTGKSFPFGPVTIDSYQIFAENARAYACVNLRPILPGHVRNFVLLSHEL